MEFIVEPERKVKICDEADVCVVGGSCTGVFAAVRAARLGAKVALIEKQNCLGGTATNGLINIWHSLYDTDGKNQIIAGLTLETLERLKKAGAVWRGESITGAYHFNSQELKIELDNYIRENKIRLYLHTYYAGLLHDGNKIKAVIIENKDGRSAVKAGFFVDATGDGDLCRDLNIESYQNKTVQPPSSCFLMKGDIDSDLLSQIIRKHGHEEGLEDDWGWSDRSVCGDDITLRADNHVFNVICNKARDLTFAEMEGRRQMRAFINLLKKYGHPDMDYSLVAACSHIGIRETAHYKTLFKATEKDLLMGKRYPTAVLNGTYRVDIHHSDNMGITFKYLDGTVSTFYGKNTKTEFGNWRTREGITGEPAKYYQLPLEVLIQDRYENFIMAGRMLNADEGAFGALRVMVNLNQLGEAAGVAAFETLNSGKPVWEIDRIKVRRTLKDGGSALI
ncbi:MAG TPA: FAD-dependent oxidoreductase [Clostridiales bacterium]|nr:FAD-dependent oxidoreductase [Clostridiales bacterium]